MTIRKIIRPGADAAPKQKILLEKVKPAAILAPAEEDMAPQAAVEHPVIPEDVYQNELQRARADVREKADQEIAAYRQDAFLHIDTEKEEILDKAYQEGYEKGVHEGEKQLHEKASEVLATLNSAAQEKHRLLEESQRDILALALKAAQQIVLNEISLNPAVCLAIVSDAIKKVTDTEKVILRVSPDDLEFMKENREKLTQRFKDIKQLIIQEDKHVDRGGCVIETQLGYIDSTLKTKIEILEKALFDVYEDEKIVSGRQRAPEKMEEEVASEPVPEMEEEIADEGFEPEQTESEPAPVEEKPAEENELDLFDEDLFDF